MNSLYWKNKILNDMFRSSGITFWLGLSSSVPATAGGNVSEPDAAAGYRRIEVNGFAAASGGAIANRYSLAFPKSTAEWFTSDNKAVCWVLFDGSDSNAHVLCSGMLETPIEVLNYTTVTLGAGTIRMSIGDN